MSAITPSLRDGEDIARGSAPLRWLGAKVSKAVGRLRNKSEALEKALRGKIEEHHRLILEQLLALIDALDKSADAVVANQVTWELRRAVLA